MSDTKIKDVLRCKNGSQQPPFLPAIYEHKGWFIGTTPSAVSRDTDLLTASLLKEHELLGTDALTVGIDVYNLEAEAAGCKVTFYEGDDESIPGISPGNHVVKPDDTFDNRPIPNPLKSGRMPVNIEAARRVRKELGDDLWIRGAVSGPFSLAVSLMGAEDLFMNTLDNPQFVHDLLAYSCRIIKEFGMAYIDVGVDVVIFDSQASADLLPPDMYEEFVLPAMKSIIDYFAEQGVRDVPLVIGGSTTPLMENLIASGANNLLCDFNCEWEGWKDACEKANRSIRRNLNPLMIQTATSDKVYQEAKTMIEQAEGYPGFIMGTAVIPFGTPTENLLAIKQACLDS